MRCLAKAARTQRGIEVIQLFLHVIDPFLDVEMDELEVACAGASICFEERSEPLLVVFDFVLNFDRMILIQSLGRSPCI
jgi:hypothetical protein